MAHAAVIAKTEVLFPAEVTVGDTGLTGSLVLTNDNDGTEFFSANNVCNPGSGSPCDGARGISLIPSCTTAEGLCQDADAGVFDIFSTATGTAGDCVGRIFSVTDLPGIFGEVLFTPTAPAGELTLNGEDNLGFCKIDFTFDVVKMPSAGVPEGGGLVTEQIGEAAQYAGALSLDRGLSSTTVFKATPQIAMQASAGVALGGSVTATATVTGRVNPTPGATVTFTLFGPDGPPCQPPAAFTSTVPIADNGTATSAPFPPLAVGTYQWIASYDGDDNNATAGTGCGGPGQTVTVTPAVVVPPPPPPATPTIGILASPGVKLGGQVSAAVNLTGRRDPVPGATVLFRLFGPDDIGCSSAPLFAAAVPVNAAGFALSPPFTPPLQVGLYRWVASFNGDANNVAVATPCGGPNSTVLVDPLPAGVLSAGFTDQPRVGQTSFLTVAGFDPLRPIAGLQVQFGEPRGLSGISACRLSGFGISLSPVRLRLPYTFRRAGRHTITVIILSGTCSGELTRTVLTIRIDVAAGGSTRAAYAAAPRGTSARAAQSTCKNTFLRPTSRAATRLKVATAIRCLVNVERRKQRLKALRPSTVLARAAAGHSQDMLRRHFFEHAGPGGPSLRTRLQRVRYRGANAAENIAYGSNFNAKLVVRAWMNSPPHKANILAPQLRFLGVGIAVGIPVSPGRPGSTYTQVFGSSVK